MKSLLFAAALGTALVAGPAMAQDAGPTSYRVTITNLSPGLTFTPPLVAAHYSQVSLLALGEPAAAPLEALAEAGDTGPLSALVGTLATVGTPVTGSGPIAPGESLEVMIEAGEGFDVISVAGMLLPTNDGMYAVDGVSLPGVGEAVSALSPGFDAGTEANDELCASIPGPDCGGEGISAASGEGFLHIHSGIHGTGDLAPAQYDWRNPVALITVEVAGESPAQP